MSSILKDLYDGNLCPAGRDYTRSKSAKDYKTLLSSQVELGEQLEDRLDVQARDMFNTYCKMQVELNILEEEDLFLYAFRLGARMLLEILSPRDGIQAEDF